MNQFVEKYYIRPAQQRRLTYTTQADVRFDLAFWRTFYDTAPFEIKFLGAKIHDVQLAFKLYPQCRDDQHLSEQVEALMTNDILPVRTGGTGLKRRGPNWGGIAVCPHTPVPRLHDYTTSAPPSKMCKKLKALGARTLEVPVLFVHAADIGDTETDWNAWIIRVMQEAGKRDVLGKTPPFSIWIAFQWEYVSYVCSQEFCIQTRT